MCDSGVDETKVRCLSIRPKEERQELIVPLTAVEFALDEMKSFDDGEVFEVKLLTLTQHQIDNLSEHDGW